METAEKETKPLSGHTTINENGRFVIPVAVRAEMGVKAGDSLVWSFDGGVLHVQSYRASIRKMQKEMQMYKKPGSSVTDEFIAERREEAKREQEQGLG